MAHYVAGQRRQAKRAAEASAAVTASARPDAELVQLARAQGDAQERTARSTRLLVGIVVFVLVWVVLAIVFTHAYDAIS